MSWSGGPVAGAAPYQPQPFANGQPGYSQQQPPQYGQQPVYGQYQTPGPAFPQGGPPQRPPDSRLPKKKGNPIITRYPPPPGYRGPAQPQTPFGTTAPQYQNPYPTPQQTYPPGPPAPTNYPNQGYSATPSYAPNQSYSPQTYGPPQTYPQQPNYAQSGYVQGQGQNPQYPQQSYPPNQGYPHAASTYPSGQGYAPPQASFQGYPPQSTPVDPNQQAYVPHQGWQPPATQPSFPPTGQPSFPPTGQPSFPPTGQYNSYTGPPANGQLPHDTNAIPTPTSAQSQSTPINGLPDSTISEQGSNDKPQLFLAWDDWDFDFDGAIWPKSNEPIDPNLSLGVIIWRPAKQVTRALPSTYIEAEEQALKPLAEKLGNGESVSMYFTVENSHEAFLDVRQTDQWENIRHDAVFTVFKDEEMSDPDTLVSLEQCIAERDRPDLAIEEAIEEVDEDIQDAAWNVMDHLEKALLGHDEEAKPPRPYTQTTSPRSQAQEDILAILGVTGSPKPPSNESAHLPFTLTDTKPSSLPERPPAPPGPHLANIVSMHSRPEPPLQRAHSYAGSRNSNYGNLPQRPYGSMSSSDHPPPPPPPPPPPERPHFDSYMPSNSQNQSNSHAFNDSRESPARSEGSNRTLAGSDFDENPSTGVDDASAPPPEVPQLNRSDSSLTRKRSYDDTDQDDEKLRQQDDHTRRKRRSQVASVYSRR
ncbi:hypothetical protein K505DRAFT_331985 [Melanomma pulvis-pyrius CBS 109.77]|uniref:Uncharacterized protein n=1 Tax=Melanomma pulvis-pyrius CBS 109.77 TaxID=1314802 RepID=A0A6A6XVK4_9PLEO|nr:hypothetical protein K505DRAFT_331985 [Melanomma pulvis-pyrius CBS 109.77]